MKKKAILFVFLLLPIMMLGRMKSQEKMIKQRPNDIQVFSEKESYPFLEAEELRIERPLDPLSTERIIVFLSVYQRVQVYLGSEKLYERKTYNTGRTKDATTSGWNFVQVPPTQEKTSMIFVFSSPYKGYTNIVRRMLIGSREGVTRFLLKEYVPSCIMDIGLVVFAMSMFFYSFHYRKNKSNSQGARYLGWLGLLFAIWLHTGTVSIPMDYLDDYAIYIISFASFLAIPMVAILFVKEVRFRNDKVMNILLLLFMGNYVWNFLLQIFNIRDMIEMVWTTHILMCVLIFAISSKIVSRFIIKDKRYLEILGFFAFAAAAIWEVGSFYARKEESAGELLRVGILLFLGCLAARLISKRERLEEAKLQLVMSQISPHFIFNALGAVRILIKTDPTKAYHMIYDFSKYVRANLNSLEKQEVILCSEELSHVKAYTNIEEIRFAGKIKVTYHIQEESFYVVPLSVQPLVENAIRHGLRKGKEEGEVQIESRATKESYIIEIRDNGVGFDAKKYNQNEPVEAYHIGIEYIRYRIKQVLGGQMNIRSIVGEGTVVTLTFPKNGTKRKRQGDGDSNENNVSR